MNEEKAVITSEWIKKVRRVLDELGVSYEAEEAVRIHIDDIVIQISEAEEGLSVAISLALPSEETIAEDLDRSVQNFRKALELASNLKSGELTYELDTSLPGYPYLYVVRKYRDVDILVSELEKALKALK